MPGMKWDREARNKPLRDSYDYSASIDAQERGIVFGNAQAEAFDRLRDRREKGVKPAKRPAKPVPQTRATRNTARKVSKEQLAQRVAKQMGISVEELRRLRKHQENQSVMTAEAARRGITLKELRQLMSGTPSAKPATRPAVKAKPPQTSETRQPDPPAAPGAAVKRIASAGRDLVVSRTKRRST
ncbi:MAG: hypothetical protein ACOYXM_17725 [Actinomycetota bacterium]